jgi:hypothetical protein
MVKPFRSDHHRIQALPLDLPVRGDAGAVTPTACALSEGAGWQGTASRQGERLGRKAWEACQEIRQHNMVGL